MLNMGIVPLIVITVLWLVFLEGLLSADNALVLAMMVRHLPRDEQKRALRYGIWGAFAFLLARFKGLESGAYGLFALIGLKLVAGGLYNAKVIPFEFNEWVFWGGMLAIVIASFFYRPRVGPPISPEDTAVIEEVARVASG